MHVRELQVPLDAVGFSIRRCPSCSGEFQVRATRRDGAALAHAMADRVPETNRLDLGSGGVLRHCPYCGATHSTEGWWTEAQRRWLDAEARSLADEIRWRRMRLPYDRLRDNPRPTYVSVRPSAPPAPASDATRAMGAEDVVTVPLPCCGEELRVMDAWIAPVRCHYCGLVHARRAVRDVGLELAQLRAWRSRVGP